MFQSIRLKERNLINSGIYKLRNLFSAAGFVLNKVYKEGVLNINEGEEKKDSIAIRIGNIDEVLIFVSGKIIGGKAAPTAVEGRGAQSIKEAIKIEDLSVKQVGSDVLMAGRPVYK